MLFRAALLFKLIGKLVNTKLLDKPFKVSKLEFETIDNPMEEPCPVIEFKLSKPFKLVSWLQLAICKLPQDVKFWTKFL